MLQKIKNRPLWYKLWAMSVAISALYFLIKIFVSEPTPLDRFLEVYALSSLLLDMLIFPKESIKTNGNEHLLQ